ncbi:hypothetical protein HYT52_00045 [Candidatus Woesearchaeota archaeon]|nr:hypothetical protein [Candidatus Woesearchaeota archaeon]
MEQKYTLDTYARQFKLTRASALNKLSKLRKKSMATVSGGGYQKRIYTVSDKKIVKTNGFYDLVNKYSPEKLVPKFEHVIHGKKYTVEEAIIEGIKIGDVRTLQATKYLFRNVKNWTRLFKLAKNKRVVEKVKKLYLETHKEMKTRRIPKRYLP